MRIIAALLAIGMAPPLLASSAGAECVCRCEEGKLRTICTSPLDIGRCTGSCIGSMCVGLCMADAPVADQSRRDWEVRELQPLKGMR